MIASKVEAWPLASDRESRIRAALGLATARFPRRKANGCIAITDTWLHICRCRLKPTQPLRTLAVCNAFLPLQSLR